MNRIVLSLFSIVVIISLLAITGCGGSGPANSTTSSTQTSAQAGSQSGGTTAKPGALRNENWLIGTWSATVPKSKTNFFSGKKMNLLIASAVYISNEQVQGNPTGKVAYTGALVWDAGGSEQTLNFIKEDWNKGDGSVIWEYASPGANQYMENISFRMYNNTMALELDWGPQISKPGSSYNKLECNGSIQNLDTSEKDFFEPTNKIVFSQTSTAVPNIGAAKPTSTSGGGTSTTSTAGTSSPTKTTPSGSGTGDIWSDIPIYPNAVKAEDEGFGLSVQGDPSFSQIEWRFFAVQNVDLDKVADFYKEKMAANKWNKMMWVDVGEMSYGTFEKNNETRMAMIYLILSEGGVAMNIMSSAK